MIPKNGSNGTSTCGSSAPSTVICSRRPVPYSSQTWRTAPGPSTSRMSTQPLAGTSSSRTLVTCRRERNRAGNAIIGTAGSWTVVVGYRFTLSAS